MMKTVKYLQWYLNSSNESCKRIFDGCIFVAHIYTGHHAIVETVLHVSKGLLWFESVNFPYLHIDGRVWGGRKITGADYTKNANDNYSSGCCGMGHAFCISGKE